MFNNDWENNWEIFWHNLGEMSLVQLITVVDVIEVIFLKILLQGTKSLSLDSLNEYFSPAGS